MDARLTPFALWAETIRSGVELAEAQTRFGLQLLRMMDPWRGTLTQTELHVSEQAFALSKSWSNAAMTTWAEIGSTPASTATATRRF